MYNAFSALCYTLNAYCLSGNILYFPNISNPTISERFHTLLWASAFHFLLLYSF